MKSFWRYYANIHAKRRVNNTDNKTIPTVFPVDQRRPPIHNTYYTILVWICKSTHYAQQRLLAQHEKDGKTGTRQKKSVTIFRTVVVSVWWCWHWVLKKNAGHQHPEAINFRQLTTRTPQPSSHPWHKPIRRSPWPLPELSADIISRNSQQGMGNETRNLLRRNGTADWGFP